MTEVVLVDGTSWFQRTFRKRKLAHKRYLQRLASEINTVGDRVHAKTKETLESERKYRGECGFSYCTVVRQPKRRFIFHSDDGLRDTGIASIYKVKNAPVTSVFVAILSDGRVLLNGAGAIGGYFRNAMKPLEFVDGYRRDEKTTTLEAVLASLVSHS